MNWYNKNSYFMSSCTGTSVKKRAAQVKYPQDEGTGKI
jgi:hypothetical protein